jgi:hypothetical protein
MRSISENLSDRHFFCPLILMMLYLWWACRREQHAGKRKCSTGKVERGKRIPLDVFQVRNYHLVRLFVP